MPPVCTLCPTVGFTSRTPIFRFDVSEAEVPFLRFGETAPISALPVPTISERNLKGRLRTIYENSMAGALRMRARAGDGVAWLPQSLVAPEFETGMLVRTGSSECDVPPGIHFFRNKRRTNRTTRSVWSFLESFDGDRLSSDR